MAASGEATVTHSRSLEHAAMLSVWIGPTWRSYPSRLTFRCHAVDSPLAMEKGRAGC
jgi:hypothetical protein